MASRINQIELQMMDMKKIQVLACSALLAGSLGWRGAAADVDFLKDIAPVLAEHCLGCHGEERVKGRYRIDSKESAFKGGSSGDTAVLPGKPDESELIRRITLPKDDDDLMPPEEGPLPEELITLLKEWVAQGAKWPDGETVKVAVKAPVVGDSPTATGGLPRRPVPPMPELPGQYQAGPKEAQAIAALAAKGIEVRPIAQGVPWKEVNLRLKGSEVTDDVVNLLKDIPSLIEVRLGNTKVTDAGLASLSTLPHLQVLGLELTGVTDAGLAHVAKLKNLVYLNLYGTSVSDKGIGQLSGLAHLRNVYLWQTAVTQGGVEGLVAALPGCQVNLGVDWGVAETKSE